MVSFLTRLMSVLLSGRFALWRSIPLSPQEDPPMFLLVGLGNPGSEYARHRHNIGFMAIEAVARAVGAPAFSKKYKGLWTEARMGAHKVGLLMPQTFMNLSGQSVQAAAAFYKITPDRIFVFHDELDLPSGKLRIKKGGGAAGHNGLRSLDEQLGTQDYWRVRLGIGHPGDRDRVTGYVLGNFAPDDQAWLDTLLPALAKHIALLLDGRDNDFMSKVAAACAPLKPKKEKEQQDGL